MPGEVRTIKKLSNNSWPSTLALREKLIALGPDALTDIELLALFLRTGTRGKHVLQFAEELLAQFGSFDKLMTVDQTMSATYGLGVSKCTQLWAICEIVQRIFRSRLIREDTMTSPDDCSHVSRQPQSPYQSPGVISGYGEQH